MGRWRERTRTEMTDQDRQWSAHRERADKPLADRATWEQARDALIAYLTEEYRDDTCPHCLSQAREALAGLAALAPGAAWEDSVDGEDLELKRVSA